MALQHIIRRYSTWGLNFVVRDHSVIRVLSPTRVDGTSKGDDPAPRSASVSRPQSAFEGSDRQLRGRVLGLLRQGQVTSSRVVADVAPGENERVVRIVESLVNDGLVERKGNQLRLAMT